MKTKSGEVTNDFTNQINQAPPVSRALLAYLDRMFQPPVLSPTATNLSEQLIFQHGIDSVKAHLRGVNYGQENAVQRERTKG